jgi:hypothetical protein
MKTLRLYGAGLLVALLPTLVACNISGGDIGREIYLNAVAYGNGFFVAVGGSEDGSTILTSRDGVSWTRQTSPTSNWLTGVTYENGLFVAVGAKGTILTSPDGVSWTARTSPRTWPVRGL